MKTKQRRPSHLLDALFNADAFFFSPRRDLEIHVSRGNIVEDTLDAFTSDVAIDSVEEVFVCFRGESTEDAESPSLLLELLTAFWAAFFDAYGSGETEKILCTHIRMTERRWRAAGENPALGTGLQTERRKSAARILPASTLRRLRHRSGFSEFHDRRHF
jgi:hypothetical protein